MKTFMAKQTENHASRWYLVNAEGHVLGRLATQIATLLMGKHRPEYTPHVDFGDHVIVLNAKKIAVKGNNKLKQKTYQNYSGYTGGLKETSLERMLEEKPTEVIREAVRRMLPKNYLAHKLIKKLRIYGDDKHDHQAQKPELIEL